MDEILFEKKGHIALITFNRPKAMNAIDPESLERLAQIWMAFRDDPDLWVSILTGTGDKAFSAGADLKKLIPLLTSGSMELDCSMPGFLKGLNVYKPIVAAVNGFCLAGGTEIIQACDIRIASEHATFALTEPSLGLFPAAGSTTRLPRQIPYCRAMEILLIGDPITAQEALQMGLINRVVAKEELMPAAWKLAERICENGPIAVQAIKESVIRCLDVPVDQAFVLETYYARKVFATEDAREGPKAFVEKRKPVFKGR